VIWLESGPNRQRARKVLSLRKKFTLYERKVFALIKTFVITAQCGERTSALVVNLVEETIVIANAIAERFVIVIRPVRRALNLVDRESCQFRRPM
jgi:hypothetical protein